MLNLNNKIKGKIYLILASTLLLSACNHNVNLPQDIPYINRPATLSKDMFIRESNYWMPGTHHIDLEPLLETDNQCTESSDCMSAASYSKNPTYYQTWHGISWNIGSKQRVLGIVPKGTMFRIDEIYEPQMMSDGCPYLMATILSGKFKGLQVRSMENVTLQLDVKYSHKLAD